MLRLSNLRKTFGKTVAVDGLSLEISRGEVFGLLGPNGAGKSTTINMAVGLLQPDSGEVRLDGAGSPLNPEVRRKLGVAPQAIALYDDLTAEGNLRFFGSLYGLHGAALGGRIDELLAMTGLADRRRDRVGGYSGGMKRRLNLAVAMVHDPPLLLLDEPTAGVDPQSRNAIFELIESLKSRGITIVYTTHYMEEAQRLCDRIGIIDHGKLLALDTVEALTNAHGGTSVITIRRADGETRIDTNDPIAELQTAMRSGDVLNVRIDRPDLETVFLNLTGRSLRDG